MLYVTTWNGMLTLKQSSYCLPAGGGLFGVDRARRQNTLTQRTPDNKVQGRVKTTRRGGS
jgi:hypothetical protein